ncbi:hypothetical protein HYDPIDRAFT_28794 [Hydnomerulius pinastri MD-312]|uniref:Transmembrane protein n=1 Tax=Hydnomerulius pinastri MD-312 TaxID=994086 RepID=A0A0C9W0P5_9AGAM|nr:hypothetical protein HYDPIDRAFT_28794 [Hydnomerulius pinastri MD-312]
MSGPAVDPSGDHSRSETWHNSEFEPATLWSHAESYPQYHPSQSVDAQKPFRENDTFLELEQVRKRKRDVNRIQSAVKEKRSLTLLQTTGYTLHVVLVAIHVVLLGLWSHHVEHRVTIPLGTRSNTVSVGLAVTSQTFFTLYQAAMVAATQQLAFRRNLLQRQTLTATHDKFGAWTGLGAALLSVWGQTRFASAFWGVLTVTLYLSGIAVLHVTSSSLMNLETFNDTYPSTSQTILGMPSLTDLFVPSNDWSSSTAVASVVGQLSELSTIGVTNGTVYDTLMDTSGVGNATVNATTFGASCFTLPNITSQLNSDNISYSITSTVGAEQLYFQPVYPYYQNVISAFSLLGTRIPPGRQIGLISMPPIKDSQGNIGSTFEVIRPINEAGPDGYELNETISMQIMACSLYLTNQTAIVDAQTNALLHVDPPPPMWDSAWTSWYFPSADTPSDPSIDWFWVPWRMSTLSSTFNNVNSDTCLSACLITMLESRLMKLLQWYPNDNPSNQSTVPTPPVTISDLEAALANVAAAMVWTGARVNSSYAYSGFDFEVATGQASTTKGFLQSRLNINVLPVLVGLVASIVLLVLSIILVHEPKEGFGEPAVQAGGVLELIWLSGRHPEVQERLAEVREATGRNLRQAGLFSIALGRVSTMELD